MQDAGTVLEVLRESSGTVTGEPSALKDAHWVRREAARKRPGFRILEPGTSPRSPPCLRHEAQCYIARAAGRDERRYLWI